MPSPFPGMDPYLELHWTSVHLRLIAESETYLNEHLPEGLYAGIEQRTFIIRDDVLVREIYPDVAIDLQGPNTPVASGGTAVATMPIAQRIRLEEESEVKQRFLEIREAAGDQELLTSIEFVSPANKTAGDGRKQYLKKQRECRDGGVQTVEIDLTRAPGRDRLFPLRRLPPERRSTYAAVVRKIGSSVTTDYFQLPLRQPLGAILIPLRWDDDDLPLPLQPMIDRIYQTGRYEKRLRYDGELVPPLCEADAAWAKQQIGSLRG